MSVSFVSFEVSDRDIEGLRTCLPLRFLCFLDFDLGDYLHL